MINDKIKSRVIGINVGVATTSLAIVDLRGTILAQDSIPTQNYPNVNSFVEALSERVIMLAENNGGYESIRSVGMCAPSANYMTGCIENAPNMPWKGVVPIAAMLRDSIGLAVALAFIFAADKLPKTRRPGKRSAFIEEDGLSVMIQRSSRSRRAA